MARLKISTTLYLSRDQAAFLNHIRKTKPYINTAALIRLAIDDVIKREFPDYVPALEGRELDGIYLGQIDPISDFENKLNAEVAAIPTDPAKLPSLKKDE